MLLKGIDDRLLPSDSQLPFTDYSMRLPESLYFFVLIHFSAQSTALCNGNNVLEWRWNADLSLAALSLKPLTNVLY
jgi:hypothetical protein